jgi:hypothetical protein
VLQTTGDKDEYEEAGVGDVIRLDAGYQIQATPEDIAREILKGSFTPEADLSGIKIGVMGGNSELYGADYSDGVTKPWFDKFLRAVGLVSTKVQTLPIATINAGALHNEVVTGGTSGAIGRVIVPTDSADAVLNIIVTSGTFEVAGENLTGNGAIPADIDITSGTLTDAGWSYKFDTNACEHLSIRSEFDGFNSKMLNTIPTIVLTADSGKIPRMAWELAGVIHNVGDEFQWMKNAVATPNIVRDQTIPPLYVGSRFKENDFQPIVDGTTSLDLGIIRSILEDSNRDGGVYGYNVSGRVPLFNRRIGIPQNSDFDVFKALFKSESVQSEFRWGTEQYNTFWAFVSDGRLKPPTIEDQDGLAKYALQSKLTGADDEELEFVCI